MVSGPVPASLAPSVLAYIEKTAATEHGKAALKLAWPCLIAAVDSADHRGQKVARQRRLVRGDTTCKLDCVSNAEAPAAASCARSRTPGAQEHL